MTDHADLLFRGGPVFRADPARTRASAVAVRGERILAVGADLDELVGPRTEVVELAGRMLLPGFQDSHVHPVQGGLELGRCWLGEAAGAAGCLDVIRAYREEHPEVDWLLGGGWSMSDFPGGTPTAAMLDTVTGDLPAFLPNRDGHGAWVNSAALRRAGITRDTPDPADGRIERLPDGSPSGTLHEGAMRLVEDHVPDPTPEEMRQGLLTGQAYLHGLGITGWQDAIIGPFSSLPDPGPTYAAAAADGSLTGRVVGALWWDRERGLEQIPELVERRAALTGGRFRATSIKIMQDGVAENFTAAMLTPYLDGHAHPTGNAGISFVEPTLLKEAVTRLVELDFQVHFHAIGDRAVRECLDAVEAARAVHGPDDLRHHIAHIQVIHPDDVPRFRQLQVAANMQALWACMEPQMAELTIPFLGDERAAWQYPFGDLLRTGATLVMGSDWSVSTPDPLAAIHVAVNRAAPPEEVEMEAGPFLPDQALDLGTCLAAYTAGSAWVNHHDETGTIAPGMLADLALLDRDPFAHPAEEIAHTRPVATWVGGERVWGEP
ncbi:MAG: amidohydrolase [Actinomycetales bacterium]|nr:amidohydrolase [Actinomycetales bacterium]